MSREGRPRSSCAVAAVALLCLAGRADSTLYTTLAVSPTYTGTLLVSGSVSVAYAPGDPFLFTVSYALSGLRISGPPGGAHVHAGTSCGAALGHWWSNDGGVTQGTNSSLDPWGVAANASLGLPPP